MNVLLWVLLGLLVGPSFCMAGIFGAAWVAALVVPDGETAKRVKRGP